MRGFGWSCVALYCLVQLGIVSPDWLKGQWNNLTHRQTPTQATQGEMDRDIGDDSRSIKKEDGNLYD
jgi:hypothetical protein